MLKRFLFRHIDNSALIVFRVLFGFLIAAEAFGAILTGWVRLTFIDPDFTFTFIGFEWLQPLPGTWMYVYYMVMGVFGLGVMFGYKYRFSVLAYTLMWSATYFMQKASYNNHYYLLILLCLIMSLQPANRYWSLDAKKNQSLIQYSMPRWCGILLMLQMGIVYTFAAIAKMYPDWLDTTFIEILLKSKEHYPLIGEMMQQKWFHYFIAWSGLLFDLLVVPLLLWKPTRKWAFMASVFFHLFNSIVFQVGIFPYMSLGITLFFFDPKIIRNIFLRKKPFYEADEVIIPKKASYVLPVILSYFIVQLILPLRHWVIKDHVLWTEEGHRLSWRMMLRSKYGVATYKVVDKETNEISLVNPRDYLSEKQRNLACTRPDIIWQFSQYLKKEYQKRGQDVAIYVNCRVSVNGRPLVQLIDPEVDMASVKWNAFKHSEWILPSKLD